MPTSQILENGFYCTGCEIHFSVSSERQANEVVSIILLVSQHIFELDVFAYIVCTFTIANGQMNFCFQDSSVCKQTHCVCMRTEGSECRSGSKNKEARTNMQHKQKK